MRDYWLRATEQNWPMLLALGVKLGAITVDESIISATHNGGWDYIGPIHEPTGETQTDDEGFEHPVTAPKLDTHGNLLLHANLRTPLDLRAIAEASEDEDIIAGLSAMPAFFVTDEHGEPVPPNQPARVFA